MDHPEVGASLRILVVDDDDDSRELLLLVARTMSADVLEASSVSAAYRAVIYGRPDVILSDIGMPGEDGYDLMRRVRSLPPEQGGRTPAAAVTAWHTPEAIGAALQAGFDTVVGKPASTDTIRAALEGLVLRARGAR